MRNARVRQRRKNLGTEKVQSTRAYAKDCYKSRQTEISSLKLVWSKRAIQKEKMMSSLTKRHSKKVREY